MVYFPATLDVSDRLKIDAWLVRNGCRDHVALEPVIIKGNYVEYTAMSRRDKKSVARMAFDPESFEVLDLKRKRLRIRHSLRGGNR